MGFTNQGQDYLRNTLWMAVVFSLTVTCNSNTVYLGCIDQICYQLHTDQQTWIGAREACVNKQSELTTIPDKNINDWLQGTSAISSQDIWIGTRGFQYEKWTSVDSTEFTFGVGNKDDGIQDWRKSCAYLYKVKEDILHYRNGACWQNRKAICSTYVGTNEQQQCTQKNGKFYNNLCYQVIDSVNTWFKSREMCKDMGGDLAIINTPEIGGQVIQLMDGTSDYWFGVWKQAWRWSIGPDLIWTNWAVQAPDISQPVTSGWAVDSCVMRQPDGYWRNEDCSRKLAFVCQQNMQASPITSTTVKSDTEVTSGEDSEPGRIILGGKDYTVLVASLVGVLGVLIIVAIALGIIFGMRRHRQHKEPPPADPAVGYENVSFAPAPSTVEQGNMYNQHIYSAVPEEGGENPYEELPNTYQVSLRDHGSNQRTSGMSQRNSGPSSQRTSGRGSQGSGQARDSEGREVDLNTLYARPDKTKKSRGSGPVRDSGRGTSLEESSPEIYSGAPILPPKESANTTLY